MGVVNHKKLFDDEKMDQLLPRLSKKDSSPYIGETPLIEACCKRGKPCDLEFLRKVAQKYGKNRERLTFLFEEPKGEVSPPVYIAINHGNWEIARFLIEHSPSGKSIITNSYSYGLYSYNAARLFLHNRSFQELKELIDEGHVTIDEISEQWNWLDLESFLLFAPKNQVLRLATLANAALFNRMIKSIDSLDFWPLKRKVNTHTFLNILGHKSPSTELVEDFMLYPKDYEPLFEEMKKKKKKLLIGGLHRSEIKAVSSTVSEGNFTGLIFQIILDQSKFLARRDHYIVEGIC